jgi:hypothetical protein
MNFEINGKVIVKEETQSISDKFKKREFVIEVENERNSEWNDFIKFQLTQDRCDLLDVVILNEEVKVHFNVRGRKWEKDGKVNYFNSLEAWRIEKVQSAQANNIEPMTTPDEETDDLPF